MDIYIANLHSNIEEEALAKLFEVFGEVTSAILIRDKETRLSKGYGFIKMPNAIEAERAIDDMNGRLLAEKNLIVKEAIPKEAKVSQEKDGDFIKVKFENPRGNNTGLKDDDSYSNGVENISLEVKDEAKYTKTELDDGLIMVRFDN